jgi:hypothetical protein
VVGHTNVILREVERICASGNGTVARSSILRGIRAQLFCYRDDFDLQLAALELILLQLLYFAKRILGRNISSYQQQQFMVRGEYHKSEIGSKYTCAFVRSYQWNF